MKIEDLKNANIIFQKIQNLERFIKDSKNDDFCRNGEKKICLPVWHGAGLGYDYQTITLDYETFYKIVEILQCEKDKFEKELDIL